jgi:hypothetical protein
MEQYQEVGPQSSGNKSSDLSDADFCKFWESQRTKLFVESWEYARRPIPEQEEKYSPVTVTWDNLPSPVLPVGAESVFDGPGSYQYLPKIGRAPGLVIKHINGRTLILPKNTDQWQSEDRKGFYKQSALKNRGKASTKTSVKIMQNDVKVRTRTANSKINGKWIGGKRGKITSFSRGSCSAMRETARNVNGLVVMSTLTYPADFPCDGRLVKRHLTNIRKWLERRGVGAFWFLEFQQRGAPHFHLFMNGEVDKISLSEAWYKIVGSGDEKHLRAGTNVERIRKPHAIASYAAKYAAKVEQKTVPEGYEQVGRFWGTFGGVKVVPVETVTGNRVKMAPLVRVVRKLEKVNRQKLNLPPKTHKGKVGFTSYNTSLAIQKYLLWKRTVEIPF